MSSYISFPVETDAAALATAAIQRLQALIAGYIPNESNLEVAVLEAVATMESETRFVASSVATTIFRYFGKSLLNLPAIDGAPAVAPSTWTMRDASGYVIPAGTLVVIQPTGSTSVYFTTQADVTVAPGQTTTTAGEVVLVATDYGSINNALAAQTVALVTALSFVTSIASTAPTAGGVDPESDDDYLNRLRAELQLLAPRPILPKDFATVALNIPGVGRATAIDNYNPVDGSYGNQRMVTVAVADAQGRTVTSQTKVAVQTYLDAAREVNFVVNVIDPSFSTIDLTAKVKIASGFDGPTVIAAAVSAVQNYLAPANWQWSPIIRYNELIALLSDVAGVDYVASLTQPSADVTLPGVASLVSAGSVSITAL